MKTNNLGGSMDDSMIDQLFCVQTAGKNNQLALNNEDLGNFAFISDVHMGTNYKTNWYQSKYHDEYLTAALDFIMKSENNVSTIFLLGDIVDFWAFPPDRLVRIDDIINANPKFLGPDGKFAQILKKKNKTTNQPITIVYNRGNHDLSLTENDVKKMLGGQGNIVFHERGSKICNIWPAHGHVLTMFNCNHPKFMYGKCVPLGYFVTRMIQAKIDRELNNGKTAADLEDNGNPGTVELSGLLNLIKENFRKPDFSVAVTVLRYIAGFAKVSEDLVITLPDGSKMSIKDAQSVYANLWTDWVKAYAAMFLSYDAALIGAVKAATADLMGAFMGWGSQMEAIAENAQMAVYGHTHKPIFGLNKALTNYVNTGFMCPAMPDIKDHPPTFAIIGSSDHLVNMYQVVNQNNKYEVKTFNAPSEDVTPLMDFSCYVIVDNTAGKTDLTLTDTPQNPYGYYVNKPKSVKKGEIGKFWLQDFPGVHGTEGFAHYVYNGQAITLKYECPTGLYTNKCSGADFYTKSGNGEWGELNEIKSWGHPFFVKFVMK